MTHIQQVQNLRLATKPRLTLLVQHMLPIFLRTTINRLARIVMKVLLNVEFIAAAAQVEML